MALIRFRALSTVFGPDPAAALRWLRAGSDKTELLQRGHTLALHDVDLDIEAGEIFVVMGPSGSGKSTLVRHVNRLVEPSAGQVLVDGRDVMRLRPAELIALRRERLGMVFQGYGLLEHRSVVDNVAFGLELRGVARTERLHRARRWIAQVGLDGFEQHRPAQLSGGMRQRVGLARALCSDTDIVLMDEAFSSLDPLIRRQLQHDLLALQAGSGRTIVFVTHDVDEALRIGTRVALLRDGRLLQVGTPAELLMHPADAHVAAFVGDVNRARALAAGAALEPWPASLRLPPIEQAVDAETSIEQLLPRLLGATAPLAVRRDGAIVGRLSVQRVRELLAPT